MKAKKLIRTLAKQENEVAKYILGLMHESNNGVTQDYCETGRGN